MRRTRPTRAIETTVRRLGFVRVAGVDEVGRGCLAGPVVAAAVVLDPGRPVSGIRDSKQLSPGSRERLFDAITERALAWATASVEAREIDALGIQQASLSAMRHAVLALSPLPDFVLVDAFRIPDLWIAQRGVVHGDAVVTAIAAASIVAKVVRDRRMCALDREDPRFGFARHKGYGTPEHLEALARFGYSGAHRRSFRAASLFEGLDRTT